MSLKHSAGFAEALRHVFIRPATASLRLRATHASPRATALLRRVELPWQQTRSFVPRNKYKPPEGQPYNELIVPVRGYVDLIGSADGQALTRARLAPILQKLDRRTEQLVQVAAADGPGARGYPVCRLVAHKAKFEHEYYKKAAKDPLATMKKLEINWSADPKDLTHRLEAMKGFLEEGRAVEVEFLVNRDGRAVGMQERHALVNMVNEAAAEVKSVGPWKVPEGSVETKYRVSFIKTKQARDQQTTSKRDRERERQLKLSQTKEWRKEKMQTSESRRKRQLEEEERMKQESERIKADEQRRAQELQQVDQQAEQEEKRLKREAEEMLKRL